MLWWKGHYREGSPGRLRTLWLGKCSELTEEEAMQRLVELLGVDLAADKQAMIESDEELLARYLAQASGTGLSDFFLTKLDRDNYLKHRLAELLEELVENRGWLKLASIIREYGDVLRAEREPAAVLPAAEQAELLESQKTTRKLKQGWEPPEPKPASLLESWKKTTRKLKGKPEPKE